MQLGGVAGGSAGPASGNAHACAHLRRSRGLLHVHGRWMHGEQHCGFPVRLSVVAFSAAQKMGARKLLGALSLARAHSHLAHLKLPPEQRPEWHNPRLYRLVVVPGRAVRVPPPLSPFPAPSPLPPRPPLLPLLRAMRNTSRCCPRLQELLRQLPARKPASHHHTGTGIHLSRSPTCVPLARPTLAVRI